MQFMKFHRVLFRTFRKFILRQGARRSSYNKCLLDSITVETNFMIFYFRQRHFSSENFFLLSAWRTVLSFRLILNVSSVLSVYWPILSYMIAIIFYYTFFFCRDFCFRKVTEKNFICQKYFRQLVNVHPLIYGKGNIKKTSVLINLSFAQGKLQLIKTLHCVRSKDRKGGLMIN